MKKTVCTITKIEKLRKFPFFDKKVYIFFKECAIIERIQDGYTVAGRYMRHEESPSIAGQDAC